MDEAARGGGVGSTTLFIGMTVSGGMTSLSILEIHDIQYRMRTGRGSRKRGGGGALRIGVGKKSNSLFIHRQLNLSLNSLDSPFEDIEPPSQTTHKEKVELLEKPRRAVTLGTHL
jgi:hypothetical protein